jgi:alkaline phosphatase D
MAIASRREFLGRVGAATLFGAAPALALAPGSRTRFPSDPFRLGVASGYPEPDGVVLWTRLAPDPLNGGGLGPEPVLVTWEVGSDEKMTRVVRQGVTLATAGDAHSVHVEVQGLEPARPYFYRFRAGDATSPVGRTRTAPAPDASPARLRLAFASCAQYEQGYYAGYRDLAASDLDLLLHLGDYIYESSWGKVRVRSHGAPEPVTLDDYRNRYALYRSDPDLQAAHASCPWMVTWDDHEVDNDYAGDHSQDLDPREWFLKRRAAAYRAYYEHMPLRRSAYPYGPHLRLFARADFGRLLRVHLLDDRQYRSPQACTEAGRGGGRTVEPCAELMDPGRTLLGPVQEAWLEDGLARSRAAFNLVAQQTLMARFDMQPGPGTKLLTDGWSGYPEARRRFLEALASTQAQNPVVVGGDVHAFVVADLHRDPENPASPVLAPELVGAGITSESSRTEEQLRGVIADNPHVRFGNVTDRGYVRLEITASGVRAELRAVESVTDSRSSVKTLRAFQIEAGRPQAQTA